jgi:hypothetical protein
MSIENVSADIAYYLSASVNIIAHKPTRPEDPAVKQK